jgi:putative ABC transport system ATP-binding protein
MKIVECIDVKKSYRQGEIEVHALRDVSLAIEKGEFTAVAGPSESGKTTLLNLVGGLDASDAGSIVVDGNAFDQMSQSRLANLRLHKIGFVFQAYNLIPVLSAAENVEFVMLLQGVSAHERQQRAKRILDDVGLADKYDRRPAELSGGQQQRVAVARAIVSNPSIVLADEPTANLDSETGNGLLKMMKKMNEEKKVTFIFSTHDKMVMDYARRLVLLRDGRLADDRVKG